MWWRLGPGKGPLRWELQSYQIILYSIRQRHKVVQSFCTNAGIFLWSTIFTAASKSSYMLAIGPVRWYSLKIIRCVIPVVLFDECLCVCEAQDTLHNSLQRS